MKEQTVIRAFEMHDKAINSLRSEFKVMQKVLDKTYVQSLTHVMMWDVLMELLEKKGIITKMQFDEALKELSEKTKAAMLAQQKETMPPEGKTTVLSDQPAIPVIK